MSGQSTTPIFCAVNGMIHPGEMCGHVLVGMTYCGFDGECKHKQDHHKRALDKKSFAKLIKPAVSGKSDKYSWRLYKRFLKNGRESVFLNATETLDGFRMPDKEELKTGFVKAHHISIGNRDGGWFHGNRLSAICRSGGRTMDWAFPPSFHVAEWIDITDWFWHNYLHYGRCMFFKEEHEWITINRNSRKCAYCGKHERRTVKTRRVTKREEVWA